MQVSGAAEQTYTIPTTALSGHLGAGVAPGLNWRIVWNAGADWNGQLVSSAKVRVTASDATISAPPPGPTTGSDPYRVLRGGALSHTTSELRCAFRHHGYYPDGVGYVGFRCVKGL